MKKFYASFGALLAVVSTVVALNFTIGQTDAAVWDGNDCSSNAIIKCGVDTRDELRGKYDNSKELRALYANAGVSNATIKSNTMIKKGVVHKDGRVTLADGTVVATNAQTVGRHYKAPDSKKFTVNGKSYYKRPTTNPNIFRSGDMTAYVFMDSKGNYVGSIIKSCGNPVYATPKPKPEYKCTNIDAVKKSRTTFDFKATASAKNGAKITGYTFDFGDGKTKTVSTSSSSASTSHQYAKTGSFNVKVTVKFNVNGKTVTKTASNCATKVTVEEAPKMIKVCELATKRVITIDEKNFDSKKHSKDLDDCKEVVKKIKVCELATKKIITIDEKNFDSKKYSKNLEDCKEQPKPVATCTDLGVEKISRTEYKMNATSATKNGATINGYVFTVKDESGKTVFTKTVNTSDETASTTATVSEAGTYDVTVVVKTSEGQKSGPQCEAEFTVEAPEAPKMIEVCVVTTGEIKTIKESEFDDAIYSKDLEDCKEEVCLVEDKTVITIDKKDFDSTIHSRDLTDCDEEEVVTTEVCVLETGETKIINENDYDEAIHSKVLTDCDEEEVPETPEEKPQVKGEEAPQEIAATGPVSLLGGLFGSSALGLGVTSYIRSRRALGNLIR